MEEGGIYIFLSGNFVIIKQHIYLFYTFRMVSVENEEYLYGLPLPSINTISIVPVEVHININTIYIVPVEVVVVVGPTPPPKNSGGVQQPFLRTPADGIPPSNRRPGPLIDW